MTLLSEEVSSYLNSFLAPMDSVCKELESIANQERIPIMDPDTAQFIRVMGLSTSPKRILEIGTAIGYSAYIMLRSTQAQLTSIEIHPERFERANALFKREGLEERVELLQGDALELLLSLKREPYDWIFLDASKGQYPKFLELLLPLLAPKGLLFSDNILFQGLVSGPTHVKHKVRTLVTRLREYNHILASHPQLETSFLPIGDGLALSVHRTNRI